MLLLLCFSLKRMGAGEITGTYAFDQSKHDLKFIVVVIGRDYRLTSVRSNARSDNKTPLIICRWWQKLFIVFILYTEIRFCMKFSVFTTYLLSFKEIEQLSCSVD